MIKNEPVGSLLRHISRGVEANLNKKAQQLDLTPTQLFTLHYLCENRDRKIVQRDIENKFDLSHATVSGIISRLEAKGFILCISSDDDRRYKTITVTEKAVTCDEDMHNFIMNTESELLNGFSAEEKIRFIDYIMRVIDNLKIELPHLGGEKEEDKC